MSNQSHAKGSRAIVPVYLLAYRGLKAPYRQWAAEGVSNEDPVRHVNSTFGAADDDVAES